MKRLKRALIIIFLTLQTQMVWSAGTITSETDLNSKLLDNAKVSRENIKSKDPKAEAQQIHGIGTGQVTPTNSISSGNLTDQEVELKENFIHQGRANQILTEKCSGENASICSGEAAKHKFIGVDTTMVKAIAQAYALFGVSAGGSFGSISKGKGALAKEAGDKKTETPGTDKGETPKETPKETSEETSKDKADKKANDYCKYIPSATEGISTAVQMANTKELSAPETGNGDTAQKDALLKAAKSHDSRAKMAQIQAAGWFGGAACYAVNVATGKFAMDKNLIIKLGAATLLGGFYQSEVKVNKEYADKTRKIADSLPGKGDCNPITDNLCYCSQPSTENDPTYCAKGLSKKAIAATSYRIACTNDQLKIDPTCECEKNNSCFDTFLETQGEGALELGGLGYSNSPFKAIRSLARGELLGSTINTTSTDKTSALAKRGLREISSKLDNNGNLNKDQKAMADAMIERGIPANVASLMAGENPSQSSLASAMAHIRGGSSGLTLDTAAKPKGSNVVDFSGGNGLGYKGAASSKGASGAEDILAKLAPGQKAAINSKILEFAQKADRQAQKNVQIRAGSDTPLFEIISLRYQTSGRRLLQVKEE